MRRLFAGAGGLGLLLAGLWAGLWVGALWRGPSPQEMAARDVVLAVRDVPDPLQIMVLGSSLSHNEPWTDALEQALDACLGPTEVRVVARPGAGAGWGRGQLAPVAYTRPDLVLVEFAINDADLRDGLLRGRADVEMRALMAELGEVFPSAALAELTMSPASGLRGLLRPGLSGLYADVITRADEMGHGAIDLYARWLALPRDARGLNDGLHPEGAVAASVIVPPVRAYIGALYGAAC